jgi:hypothetical protein
MTSQDLIRFVSALRVTQESEYSDSVRLTLPRQVQQAVRMLLTMCTCRTPVPGYESGQTSSFLYEYGYRKELINYTHTI